MFQPVKDALGEFMVRFHQELVPSTPAIEKFLALPAVEAIRVAPSRMIDEAEEMFGKYLREENLKQPATRPHFLPVIIVALAADYTPVGRDFTRQSERRLVVIPEDPKGRVFGLRALAGDMRMQVAIFAEEDMTARDIAAQLCLYIDRTDMRTVKATYSFAGVETKWPVQLETPEVMASRVPTGAKNLAILVVDLNFHCTVPIFDAPKEGEPNDGKGTPGDPTDPAGYPVTVLANVQAEVSK